MDNAMDEIVRQALAKWPNVPHCYGWLALDARGSWRMRDEQAQRAQRRGDRIANAALVGFINRNYTCDEQGRWYFQNGPQRVYVNLEATPYIARTDPVHGFVLHTGEPVTALDAVWMTDDGRLVLETEKGVALVDDRDMAHCLTQLRMKGRAASDAEVLDWLERQPGTPLFLDYRGTEMPLQPVQRVRLPERFGFVQAPQAEPGSGVG
jgi:hypothetical protein